MLGVFANQVIQGVLLGGVYAMFALGLSLSIGVMRFVNIAHGDLIVFASYCLFFVTGLGLHPFAALALLLPFAFAGGYVLQRLLLQRVVGKSMLSPLLVTLGLAIILQNGLLQGFGANPRKLSAGALGTASIRVDGWSVGFLPLLTLCAAIALIGVLDRLLYHSRLGARIRAVSDDVAAADLIGLPSAGICALAMGLVGLTVAVAACFIGLRVNFDPASGPGWLLTAFEAVVLGGLGSLWGTLAGGILLGVAQSLGAQLDAAWQALSGHLVFLAVFLLRPRGLFPKE